MFVFIILYVPCLYSIWKHLRDNSCYKLLFYIGITDLAILWIIGFFSGWLNLRGAVFCSYPTTIYFVGILAFNRCVDIISPNLSRVLFSGRRTSLWIIACSMYALYWALFIQPGVYSSLHFGWFFNPFIGYRNVDIYKVR
uniref:G_PROTEIN_RECEP_F1_2 domain-containing protein n=1 Tax=Globodera pallida TaxID=36090 RepID=A0A183CFH0_GLOPA